MYLGLAVAQATWYNSLGKYQIQGRQKEQLYTKDKTALKLILSNCTRTRTGQLVCVWGKYLLRLMKMLELCWISRR